MSKGIEIIKDRLQRKRKQYIRQKEKMEQISDTYREPRVIPMPRWETLSLPVYEFLQHRLKLHSNMNWHAKLSLSVINLKVGHIFRTGISKLCYHTDLL
jgi:hypothetical protein